MCVQPVMDKSLSLSFDNAKEAFAYKSDQELKKANLIFSVMRYDWLVKLGSFLTPLALKMHLPVRGLIRNTIFKQFCGGETLEETAQTAEKLADYKVAVILDYGVEAAEGEKNYDRTVLEFQKAITYAAWQPNIPFISLKMTGFARFGLLKKIHANKNLTPEEEQEMDRVRQRIRTICQTAFDNHIGVMVDAEESWIQQPVDDLAEEMMEAFNRSEATVFNTFQLYRHDRITFLKRAFEKSLSNHYLLGVKLVRGAYLEKERKRAEEEGYPSPIQPDKKSTDRDYNEAVKWCLNHLENIVTFIGTHNEESCMLGAQLLHKKGFSHDHPHVHFSQLYGMSDHITFNLAGAGYRVSKYLPYGPVKDVLPYLIRRAQENTAISGQMGREMNLIQSELKRRKLE